MRDEGHPRTLLLPRRAFISTLIALLAALIALPVLADHIGPHRTVTTFKWERLACHYEAVYDPDGTGFFGCTLTLYEPPDGSCPSDGDVAGLFNPSYCVGWPGSCGGLPCDISSDDSIQGCGEGETGCRAVEKTSELPPATVSGSISCDTPGSGGWCRGGGTLSISGDEPLDGESIVSIEGTRNGETFACSGAACDVPLLEGDNSFTFWARSSYGDTSEMGNTNGKLDSAEPALSGELNGLAGDGGWFVSEVTVSASASDSGSGLASLEVQIDGGGWSAYGAPIVVGEGEHTVELRAMDVAGNSSQTSQSVEVDTVVPEIGLSAGDAFCPGCGQTLEIELSVADSGSGVGAWSLTADGVGVASGSGASSQTLAWDGSGLGGGGHSFTLQATDVAGNSSSASAPFTLIVPTPKPDPPTDEPESEPPPPPTSSGYTPTTIPTATSTAMETSASQSPIAPTAIPVPSTEPTSTPLTIPFDAVPAAPLALDDEGPPPSDLSGPQGELPTVSSDDSSQPLFGAAAAALIAAASAAGLIRLRKREKAQEALRNEMAERNKAAKAREEAQRVSMAAAAAAVAAAEAVERVDRRRKAEYLLAEHEARLEHLGPPPAHPAATWARQNSEASATQLVARWHLFNSGQLSSTQPALQYSAHPRTPEPPSGTATPVPSSTPVPAHAPFPPGFVPLVEPWTQVSGQVAIEGVGQVWKYGRIGRGIYRGWPLRFAQLESGNVSVRVADSISPGQRLGRRLELRYPGTRYNVGTLSRLTAGNLIRRAARNANVAVPLFTTLATNVYDFGWGSQRDKGIWSNEFAASSMVDFAVAGLTGLAAAGTVAVAVAAAGAVGATFVATAPLAALLGATAVIGVGLGLLVDRFVDTQQLKDNVAGGLSAWGGISRNAVTIRNAAFQGLGEATVAGATRARDGLVSAANTVANGIESAGQAVSTAVGQVTGSAETAAQHLLSASSDVISDAKNSVSQLVGQAAEDAAENVGQFFKGLFGSGES